MMEFILALPFLWLIIAVSIGFGGGWLARQRAAVVVREHAFLDSGNTGTSETEAELLNAVKLHGEFSSQATGTGLSASLLDKVLSLLAGTSNAHKVCFQGSRDPNIAAFQSISFTECFEVDSDFWTYDETKDNRTALIGRAIGGGMFLGILGSLF